MQDNVQPLFPPRPDPLDAALLAAWNAGEPEESEDAPAAPEPSDLDTAVGVARQLLDSHNVIALQEALRLILRAVGTRPATAPALTDAQRTPVYDESAGYYAAAPIVTAVRDIDADDPHGGPFLEARLVVQPWDGQQHGRFTRVWVSYGTSTGELTPAQARQIAREMGAFGAQLLALADHADEVAAAQEDPAGSFFDRHFPEIAAFLASERGDEPQECGARRSGWEHPGPGRHRLPCTLSFGHDGPHRDAFAQGWTEAGR